MDRHQWMRSLTAGVLSLALFASASAQVGRDGDQNDAGESAPGGTERLAPAPGGDADNNDEAARESASKAETGKQTPAPGGATESDASQRGPSARRTGEPPTLESLEFRLAKLESANATLIDQLDLLKAEVRRLNQQVGRLAEGGSAGTVLGNMAVGETLDEDLARAVQGQVVINNQTDETQTFYLNGTRWQVPAGKYQVWVPLGRVTAHLSGEQPQQYAPDRWKLVRDPGSGQPRHYRLRLAIGDPAWQTVQPTNQ